MSDTTMPAPTAPTPATPVSSPSGPSTSGWIPFPSMAAVVEALAGHGIGFAGPGSGALVAHDLERTTTPRVVPAPTPGGLATVMLVLPAPTEWVETEAGVLVSENAAAPGGVATDAEADAEIDAEIDAEVNVDLDADTELVRGSASPAVRVPHRVPRWSGAHEGGKWLVEPYGDPLYVESIHLPACPTVAQALDVAAAQVACALWIAAQNPATRPQLPPDTAPEPGDPAGDTRPT